MLILFSFIVLIVLFYQKEQMDILRMFSVSDCKDNTPTTEEMKSIIFKIFMMSNILLYRDSKLPREQTFFNSSWKLKRFIQKTLNQSQYFKWFDFSEEIYNGIDVMLDLYATIRLGEFSKRNPSLSWGGNIMLNPLDIDPKNKISVKENMISVFETYFSDKIYSDEPNLGPSFELLKELLNDTHCYCKQTNPFIMIFTKPSDYKYCKQMSKLLFYNNTATLIGALIIVIMNVILQMFINYLFKKVNFTSNINKSTIKILITSMALFFNILVFLFD